MSTPNMRRGSGSLILSTIFMFVSSLVNFTHGGSVDVDEAKPERPSLGCRRTAQDRQDANQIKAHLDSTGPKRPTKPNRSEPDSPTPALSVVDQPNIPELHKLRTLQSQSHVIISDEGANTMVQEEFVDTQYYKELNSIDKQRHRTGTGFIRVDREEGSYDIQLTGIHGGSYGIVQSGFRSNPATNDWIPKTDEDLVWI